MISEIKHPDKRVSTGTRRLQGRVWAGHQNCRALSARGYGPDDIAGIMHGSLLRFLTDASA